MTDGPRSAYARRKLALDSLYDALDALRDAQADDPGREIDEALRWTRRAIRARDGSSAGTVLMAEDDDE